MSRNFVFAVPGDLATQTGGYAYDRRMVAELKDFGWHAEVIDLGDEFPRPSPASRAAVRVRLASVPQGRPIVIDGLALGVLPDVAVALAQSHKLIALVHHPLALETGLTAAEADALRTSERAALAGARHVIASSAATARLLIADYSVPADRVTVAFPGTDRVAKSLGSADGTVTLLSVGALVPRKGYDVLLAALARIRDLSWRLTIVGDRGRSPATAAQIDADIAAMKLDRRVSLEGAVPSERLSELYAGADLFVLPSRFEGYGMAFAEAIAHGVPVVGTTTGAIPETVPAGAGILVPPDDAASLAAVLRRLIGDSAERGRLAAGACAAAQRFPSWRASARAFAQVLETLR